MAELPRFVRINEEGPREGFQAEPRVVATDQKLALIDALSDTGLRHIVIASFVNPERVPAMADAEAVAARYVRKPGVNYSAIWLNQRGLERALATGRLDIGGTLALTASETFLARNQKRGLADDLAAQERAASFFADRAISLDRLGILAAFGCNFEGDVSVERVISLVEQLDMIARYRNLVPKKITLADTMGWANPLSVKRLVGAVRNRFPDLAICLHLHDTRGLGLANALAGLELGVAEFDAAIGGVGGCPFAGRSASGNVATEDLAFMCQEMGIETGLDLPRLIEAAKLAEAIIGRPLPGAVMKAGLLARRSVA